MPDSSPQFGTAEYRSSSGTETCKSCNQTITGRYFRVNGSLACERCVEQLKSQLPKDSHSAFVRGLLFGVGGFIAGLVLYSGFTILTGIIIGYVSLAVGFIVGKAIRFGSGGIGGRRYQIAAVVLTYAAVSMSAIPIAISQYAKAKKAAPPISSSSPNSTAAPSTSEQTEDVASEDAASSPTAPRQKTSPGAALIGLVFVGLASPFLELQDPIHGLIGLVILLVGIRIAWQLTAGPKVDILGPFTAGASTSPPPTS